jgi:Mn2+/Fe2+ NRAMP family transporter
LGRATRSGLPRSCMPSSAVAAEHSNAERNSRKQKRLSLAMCTPLTHPFGSSSTVSLAALMVVSKSSLSESGARPGGRLPTCSRRARRVIAACCCITAFIIACCCSCCICTCCACIAAAAAARAGSLGATVLPAPSTSHCRFLRAFFSSPPSSAGAASAGRSPSRLLSRSLERLSLSLRSLSLSLRSSRRSWSLRSSRRSWSLRSSRRSSRRRGLRERDRMRVRPCATWVGE